MIPSPGHASPVNSLSLPAMIFISVDLPDAVGADDADLGVLVELQVNVVEDRLLGPGKALVRPFITKLY